MELNQVNQVNQTNQVNQLQQEVTPIGQDYVSATYARHLEVRIKELQDKLQENQQPPLTRSIFAALDEHIRGVVEKAIAEQEDNIRQIAEDAAETKITEHTNEYDHYEMECQIERIDDKIEEVVEECVEQAVRDLDIRDKINDALNGATISISV